MQDLKAEITELKGQLICANVIAEQTQKIEDDRQRLKLRNRELENENAALLGTLETERRELRMAKAVEKDARKRGDDLCGQLKAAGWLPR